MIIYLMSDEGNVTMRILNDTQNIHHLVIYNSKQV